MAVATSGRPTGLPAAASRIAWYALTVIGANGANILTLIRLVAIGPILLALTAGEARLAFWIFFAAALTDAADGFVAKRLTGTTPVGAVLDPVADKLLLASLLLTLAMIGALPWWLAVLSLARDALIVTGSLLWRLLDPAFRVVPSRLGKLCTLVQLLLVGAALAALGVAPELGAARDVLVWGSVAAVLASGTSYLVRGWRRLSPRPV